DWYHLDVNLFKKGTSGMNKLIHPSTLPRELEMAYPEFEWYPWLFPHLPSTFWSKDTSLQFLLWMKDELQLYGEAQWSALTADRVMDVGGDGLLAKHNGSLYKLLQEHRNVLQLSSLVIKSIKQK